MVVITVGITGQLVAPATFREFQFLEQAHGTQEPQGAVHGCQGHPLLLGQKPLMHLFGTEVAAGTALLKQGEHPLALGSEPLAAIVEGGAQGIGSDSRLEPCLGLLNRGRSG
jgi:hypothetical protein